jgi:hypothetical protein
MNIAEKLSLVIDFTFLIVVISGLVWIRFRK